MWGNDENTMLKDLQTKGSPEDPFFKLVQRLLSLHKKEKVYFSTETHKW